MNPLLMISWQNKSKSSFSDISGVSKVLFSTWNAIGFSVQAICGQTALENDCSFVVGSKKCFYTVSRTQRAEKNREIVAHKRIQLKEGKKTTAEMVMPVIFSLTFILFRLNPSKYFDVFQYREHNIQNTSENQLAI